MNYYYVNGLYNYTIIRKRSNMNTQTIYHIALITHLAGLIMLAGTTLVDYILTRQFWKQHAIDPTRSSSIREATSRLPILAAVGILFLIASGIYMMYVTRGAYGEQIWFRVKFGIVLLIIANGVVFGRRQGVKLRKLLSEGASSLKGDAGLLQVKANLNLFHLAQLAFFVCILTLSVFKFN